MAQAERPELSGEITAQLLILPDIVESLVRNHRIPVFVRSISGLPAGPTETMFIFIPPEGVNPRDTICEGSVAYGLEYFRLYRSEGYKSIGRAQTLLVDRVLGEEILSRVETELKTVQ